MCGILLEITSFQQDHSDTLNRLIANRGPSSVKDFSLTLNSKYIRGISSVLHLRGAITSQPLESSRFILQWNGEVFGTACSENVDSLLESNDTQFIFDQIHTFGIKHALANIKGPWAISVIDKENEYVYFARDYFGRRSLLYSQSADTFLISSVASNHKSLDSPWIEATSGLLYKLDLRSFSLSSEPVQQMKYIISSIDDYFDTGDTEKEFQFVKEGLAHLRESVRKRIIYCNSDVIGIMFSGGIDSLLIAAIAASIIAEESLDLELDLINVAFEQPSLLKSLNLTEATSEYYENVPDRIGGQLAFLELGKLFPLVKMNFVRLNITIHDYEQHKDEIIELIDPNRTVMDLSIGAVLWFGGRCALKEGMKRDFKVLLLGMGADEQLGGYSRHLSAFQSDSWNGLLKEMQMDLDRLGHRNLGRDDRCISDHGREARYPFLDEEFVNWLCKVPLCIKCNLTLPKGQGDKRIFRLMALSMGFSEIVSFRPKKAMQFGAKSAKISTSDCKGHDSL
jgi:asparagine synthetase B (glutamine-hydrolysing)